MKSNVRIGYATVLSAILMAFAADNTPSTQSGAEKAGIKGKVKSCIVITFNVIGQTTKEQKKVFLSKIKTDYNESGNVLDVINLTENNIIKNKIVYKYAADGQRLELIDTTGLFSGRLKTVKDNEGNQLETTTFASGDKIVKKYNKNHLLLENTMSNPSGKMISKAVYKYDEKGNNISENDLGFKNELINKIISQYDSDNHIVQTAYFDKNEKLTMQVINGYDKNGLLVRKTAINGLTGEIHKIWYTFSKFDNMINWTQSVELRDNIIKNIKTRELTYY